MQSEKLPSHLYGTYILSKDNTQYCAEWLFRTARDAGYDCDRFSGQISRAKDATRAAATPAKKPRKASIHLKVGDFLPLANTIAGQWPAFKIEDTFMRRLTQALSARKACAEWYSSLRDAQVADSNQTHKYFINVLENVQEILRPLHVQQGRPRRPTKEVFQPPLQPNETEDVSNSLRELHLGVQNSIVEPSADSASGTEAEAPTQPKTTKKDDVILEEANGNDQEWSGFFAFYCTLIDLHELRNFVYQTWLDYKSGKCDLVTASTITNTAIDMAIRLEKEAAAAGGGQLDTYKIIYEDFESNEKARSRVEECMRSTFAERKDLLVVPVNVQDFIFLQEYAAGSTIIREYIMRVQKTLSPIAEKQLARRARRKGLSVKTLLEAKPDAKNDKWEVLMCKWAARWLPRFEPCVPEGTETIASTTEGSAQQARPKVPVPKTHISRLLEAFNDMLQCPASEASTNFNSITDLISERVYKMCTSVSPELSSAFAIRLFLDIHDILNQEQMAQPLMLLDDTAKKCRMQAKLRLAELERKGIEEDHLFQETFDISHRTSLPRLLDRMASQLLDGAYVQEKGYFSTQINVRNLLRHNPVSCGLHIFYLETISVFTSVNNFSGLDLILPFAHLYNTAQVSGNLTLPWPDMEFIIETQTPEHLFLGGRPDNTHDCAVKYKLLTMGVHDQVHWRSPNLRVSDVYYRRNIWPRLAPMSRFLVDRWLEHGVSSRTTEDLQNLKAILVEMRRKFPNERIKFDAGQLHSRDDLRKRNARHLDLSPLELLSALKEFLPQELKQLRFDYGALQRCCNQAVSYLKQSMKEAKAEVNSELYSSPNSVVMEPMLSLWFIETSKRDYEADRLLGPRACDAEMKIWESAARGLEEWLREMRRKGVKELREELEQ